MEDLEIEVEYQVNTIGKYELDFNGTNFILTAKQTALPGFRQLWEFLKETKSAAKDPGR